MFEYFFVDKPAGFSTHATSKVDASISLSEKIDTLKADQKRYSRDRSEGKKNGNAHKKIGELERSTKFYVAEGVVEYLSRLLSKPLFVCQRLDKETTGALVFARSPQAAAKLTDLFSSRSVQKTYLFVTDQKNGLAGHSDSFSVASFIEKRSSDFISQQSAAPNAITHFQKIKSEGRFTLWQAKPETGRPHQIRLHAADSGIPILGDVIHGGSPFPSLLLHSQDIRFELEGRTIEHRSEPPIFFNQLELLQDSILIQWLAAFDRRQRWQYCRSEVQKVSKDSSLESNCWRDVHSEGGPLRIDKFGSRYSLQWFANILPEGEDKKRLDKLLALKKVLQWTLHLRHDRGRNPNSEEIQKSQADLPSRWTIVENGLKYEMRADSGLSSGLFLDQRANRVWVRSRAHEKRVLNLFCYTGAFSVCAAIGGAKKVVSVDVSRNFLEWAKRNFELNPMNDSMVERGLDPQSQGVSENSAAAPIKYEFRAMDARDFLKYAQKKGHKFDLIICDPPSFGRSDRGVFRLDNDLPTLISEMLECLDVNGEILFCCNFEAWSEFDFLQIVNQSAKVAPFKIDLRPHPHPDWDFELPNQLRQMKSVIIKRFD